MIPYGHQEVSLGEFSKLLSEGNFVVALHRHADPDAVGSAFAIASCFHASGIWAPGGFDRNGLALARFLGLSFLPSPAGARRLLAVDTSDTAQFDSGREAGMEVLLLDHHFSSPPVMADIYYLDMKSRSCSEIVLDLIDSSGAAIGERQAIALLWGAISDTGRFRRGDASTLQKCSRLLSISGIDMEHALSITEEQRDTPELIAVFKGLERMKHAPAGRYMICWSGVSSYESAVASAMVSAGADAAFVASDRDGDVRLSGRASQRAVNAGLNLVRVFAAVSVEFGASSGGHAGASVIEARGDPEALINACVKECTSALASLG